MRRRSPGGACGQGSNRHPSTKSAPPLVGRPVSIPSMRNHSMHESMNKVAQVTLAFWIMKICATTLGETGGDLLSMTLNLGYAVSTAVFFGIFLVTLVAQVTSKSYHPLMYWAVIISTTTAGT